MQIYFKQNLAFLAVPKTGTTAIEIALRPYADIIFTKRRKHMTSGQFQRRMVPFLRDYYDLAPETFAVMRDPLEQIRSWYRYRTAPKNERRENSTKDLTFDEFVLAVLQDSSEGYAQIGSQYKFLTTADGSCPVTHIFAYERQKDLRRFLNDRFEDELRFPRKNVSPEKPAPISPDVETLLREARADEFALYDKIIQAGGHLRNLRK